MPVMEFSTSDLLLLVARQDLDDFLTHIQPV